MSNPEENEEIENGTDDVQDKKQIKKTAKHDGGAADLERVTDYAEEKEISSDITNVSSKHNLKKLNVIFNKFSIF